MEIFTRIDNRLLELGLLYADLADRIKESPQTVNGWKVRGRIPVDKIRKVAAALDLTIEDLIPGTPRSKIAANDDDSAKVMKAWNLLNPSSQTLFLALMQEFSKPRRQGTHGRSASQRKLSKAHT